MQTNVICKNEKMQSDAQTVYMGQVHYEPKILCRQMVKNGRYAFK